jgi:outer membrane usher protein
MAGSAIRGFSEGYAGTFTFQRLFQYADGLGDSLNLAATTHSRDFAPVGVTIPSNPYEYELTGGYTHAFNTDLFGSLTAHYSKGRDTQATVHDYHAIFGYRLTDDLALTADTSYQMGGFYHGWGALISLTWRAPDNSSVRGDFNTHNNDARLSYNKINGAGVGSYNIAADVERSDSGSGINAQANYISNHADIGLSHFTSSDAGFGKFTNQRTSLNIGTSLAFADGAVAIGRPVTQAFAIVEPHSSLKDANVVVDPFPGYYAAESDALGSAMDGEISAYVPRTLTVDVPNAPAGYDIGTGSFRLNPPYRAGYKLVVGSDYSLTVVGQLVKADGTPLALIAGRAVEVANPDREPVTLFTNAQGRFGLSGLRPGTWKIEMPTEPETDYTITIADNGKSVVDAGTLKPTAGR